MRLLVGLSGPAGTLNPGDPYVCDDGEAVRMISARYAVPWAEPAIERAVVAVPEKRRKK